MPIKPLPPCLINDPTDHPELKFEEKYESFMLRQNLYLMNHCRFAHDTLTSYLSSKGFHVTRHYAGLDTAWRAEFSLGSGGRVIGINSEMDALPNIGHACGHNLIAVSGIAMACAIKAVMEKFDYSGTIVLLGTPGIIPRFRGEHRG